ncbi:HPF/RaiA family ribosome-associated protein [Lysobacter sp. A3-1-A15]|uniref:HPF/RaiA family ribosome-associated protein n=1 Tax=Novilysobacter viscosus TaxID=3098602 RepID=UPI002ED873DD
MKVQLNTDSNIQGDEALAQHVEGVIESTLGRFDNQVTRIEVHLSDVNAGKSGSADKHCMMEARIEGRAPVTATEESATVREAISGAARKLQRVLDTTFGKMER